MVTQRGKHRITLPPKNIRNERYYLLYKGEPGRNAYEEAVANGFVGTAVQWLASLKATEAETGTVNSYFPSGW